MITFNFTSNSSSLIQNTQNFITSTVNNFIVRPFGQPNLTGVSGFLFDILDDEEVLIESIITDNYVESNYAVQDHIALKPLRFTLRGYVSEITNDFQNSLAQIFIASQALPLLGGLTPQFNIQDTQFYAKINNVSQAAQNVVNQAQSLFSLFQGNSTVANKQQQGFKFFYDMWRTRQLCSVETPFAKFENMAIEHMRALQSGANNEISDFTVTFKMIRVTSSISLIQNISSVASQNAFGTTSTDPLLTSGRLEDYTAPITNLGSDPGTAVDANQINSIFTNQAK